MCRIDLRRNVCGFLIIALYIMGSMPLSAQPDVQSVIEAIDKAETFEEKYAAIPNLNNYSFEDKTRIYQHLLHYAKRERNIDTDILFSIYSRLAESSGLLFDHEKEKLYLDSAYIYAQISEDKVLLGRFYFLLGSYFWNIRKIDQSHKHYYKAMEYYEQANLPFRRLLSLYYNIANTYIQKQDIPNLEKIVNKVRPYLDTERSAIYLINMYVILAFYHDTKYKKEGQSAHLDSTLLYNQLIFDLHEGNEIALLTSPVVAYMYNNYAERLLDTDTASIQTVLAYAEKGKELANPVDTAMIVNHRWIQGLAFYKGKRYREAEAAFKDQLRIMEEWTNSDDLAMFTDLYGMLSETEAALGNYEAALRYEHQKEAWQARIHDREKYEIIEELQTRYEVNKKDMEIEQLNERTRYQQRINLLTVILSLILLAVMFVVTMWLRSRRQLALKQLRIAEMQKAEISYQNTIKEQQLEKMQLEKYEALLDSHFSKLEIHGKDSQLEQLRSKQQELNRQIEDYAGKLKEYEAQNTPQPTPLILEIKELITTQLRKQPSVQTDYYYKLNGVSNRFEELLQDRLSKTNIQYCVCFLINMAPEHIAQCFSIKQESLRIIRTRIKGDLGLDKNENLDRYLISLMLLK